MRIPKDPVLMPSLRTMYRRAGSRTRPTFLKSDDFPSALEAAASSRRSSPVVLQHIWLSLVFVLVTAASIGAQHVWLDADGKALPFQTDEEITEFMRTANVVNEEPIGIGINQSVKVTLEQNGVRAHAIFREVDRREDTAVIQGTRYRNFADSYLFEPAAFELAKMLDIPHVPPAVLRNMRRRRGSLQMWVEDILDEDADGFRPPSPIAWASQLWDMKFFDNIYL